jgi:hypothetical protein
MPSYGHSIATARVALLLMLGPASARADWGHSWGTLIWGGTPEVPLPGVWGLLLAVALGLLGAARLARRRGRRAAALLLGLLALAPLAALGTTISMPHVFANGTVADADEVNANFDVLVAESNAQDARLAALEATDITAVSPGTGLSGGGSAGSVSLSVDTSVIQQRVAGSCVAGGSIRSVSANGGVVCEPDDDTTYSVVGGGGLTLAGTAFSVDPDLYQRRVAGSCAVGGSIRSIDVSGGVVCEPDTDTDTTCATAGTCPTVYGNAFAYPSAQARSVVIGPERMIHRAGGPRSMPSAGGQWYVLNTSNSVTGTERYMDAGVTEIPAGATITGISCTVYDASASYEIGVNLYECTGGNCTTRLTTDWCYSGGSCTSNLANAPGGMTLTPGLTPFTWQTGTSSYHLSYFTTITGGTNCGAACRFYSCSLSYTVAGPA